MNAYHVGTFTEGYEAYWRRQPHEIEKAIAENSVVLDTNALLNLYRMDSSAREECFNVLEALAERIWIPRQVVDEFHKNRIGAVDAHQKQLKQKSEAIDEAIINLRQSLRNFAKLKSLGGRLEQYMHPFEDFLSGITQRVKHEIDAFDLNAGRITSDDSILARLAILFDGKVGDRLTPDKFDERCEIARARIGAGTPPGYKDANKDGGEAVGDCLLWLEILEYAKDSQRSVLFISNDVKDDWLRRQSGFTIGPRPELLHEMRTEAGVEYHQMTLSELLARAQGVLHVSVSQSTISQAERHHDSGRVRLIEEIKTARQRLESSNSELDDMTERLVAARSENERLRRESARYSEYLLLANSKEEKLAIRQDARRLERRLESASVELMQYEHERAELLQERDRLAELVLYLESRLRSDDV